MQGRSCKVGNAEETFFAQPLKNDQLSTSWTEILFEIRR